MSKPTPIGPEEIVFSGMILEVVHQKMDIGGTEVTFERARRSPGVRLIIPSKDRKSLLITKEHRQEIDGYDYRLPGGKLMDKLEDYKKALAENVQMEEIGREAATRELIEETGLVSENFTLLHVSKAGATVEWDLYYFLVDDFAESPAGQELEDGEHIRVLWLPNDEVRALCLRGAIQEDRSVAALLKYLQ